MLLRALLPGLLTGMISTAGAQKNRSRDNKNQDIIILKNDGKDSKITIETKDGKVFINGKPESEFKDDNVSVITRRRGGSNFLYSPRVTCIFFQMAAEKKKHFLV